MTTETTGGPTVEGVLAQLMREAEALANDAFEMSENAEPHDQDGIDQDPEEMRVMYSDLCDARRSAKRVLVLLKGIRVAFPEQVKSASIWCEVCGVHAGHDTSTHYARRPHGTPAC